MGAARQDLAKAKQRLKSFLLVHDVRYAGTANWSEAHRRWLAKFVFQETNSQLAFQEHLHAIEDRLAQCERVQTLLRESAVHWRFYPAIRAIQALRGVQFKVAVGLIAEIGEFSRFASAPQLMAWLGMTPERILHRRAPPPGRDHQVRQRATHAACSSKRPGRIAIHRR